MIEICGVDVDVAVCGDFKGADGDGVDTVDVAVVGAKFEFGIQAVNDAAEVVKGAGGEVFVDGEAEFARGGCGVVEEVGLNALPLRGVLGDGVELITEEHGRQAGGGVPVGCFEGPHVVI